MSFGAVSNASPSEKLPEPDVFAEPDRALETNTGTGVTVDGILEDLEADRR
ncbi:hypothetical protein SAMN04487904_10867 [Actinopolyspora lacussalsi subsp. righensis]|uniref:Uncharacterized protein n=1 Tax=Actinopolyspora righensis TaxID=995060 RepID=A0A1I7ATF0_9ACTN|nr:hypothetical protein SAMN04487904_10867 [Actinopolyspora righensis]